MCGFAPLTSRGVQQYRQLSVLEASRSYYKGGQTDEAIKKDKMRREEGIMKNGNGRRSVVGLEHILGMTPDPSAEPVLFSQQSSFARHTKANSQKPNASIQTARLLGTDYRGRSTSGHSLHGGGDIVNRSASNSIADALQSEDLSALTAAVSVAEQQMVNGSDQWFECAVTERNGSEQRIERTVRETEF